MRKRAAAAGVLAAILGMVTVLAITGAREPASAVKLLSGDAWLGNSNGSASHVRGYSGKVDGSVGLSRPGDPFQIIQRPDGAYVLDLRTGKLTKISSAGLNITASRNLPGKSGAIQILSAGSTTWALDRSSGVLQQLNPATLAPNGKQIPLGGPTGTAALDDEGNVWVPMAAQAAIKEVTAETETVSTHPFGRDGDELEVAMTSNGIWAIDPQFGRAQALSNPGPLLNIPPADGDISPLIGSAATSAQLAIVEGNRLLAIDTGANTVTSTMSNAITGTSEVAVQNGTAYLLNSGQSRLQSFQLAPLSVGPSFPVPPGSNQLITKDNLLFVNAPGSSQALVFNGTTQPPTPITKYATPTTAAPDPAPADDPGDNTPNPSNPDPQGGLTQQGNTSTDSGQGSTPNGPGDGGGGTTPPVTVQQTPPPPSGSTPPPAVPPTKTTPKKQPPAAPTVSTGQKTASGKTGTASFSWTDDDPGTSPITNYEVTYTVGGKPSSGTPGMSTTFTTPQEPINTPICVYVQATSKDGNSGQGQSCTTISSDDPTVGPTVKVSKYTNAEVDVTVTPLTGAQLGTYNTPIRSYTVSASPGSGTPITQTTTGTTAKLTGLKAGTEYSVSATATNTNGDSSPAGTAVPATTYSNLTAVAVTASTGDSAGELDATFKKQDLGGSGDTPTYKASSGCTISGTSVTCTGLGQGTQSVTVTATDAFGNSKSGSDSATVWTRSKPYLCEDEATVAGGDENGGEQYVTNDATCENASNPVAVGKVGSGDPGFTWIAANDPHPADAKKLMRAHVGTSHNTGSFWYYLDGASETPSDGSSPSSEVPEAWVFSSPHGPNSVAICNVKSKNSNSPYFYNLQAASGSSCTGPTYYT